jgi:rare lipoprotein A
MKKILTATFLFFFSCFISSCQTANSQMIQDQKTVKKTHPIYDRYRNTTHRYTIKQDAAPSEKKNITLKELVPSKEPLSRYGNPIHYGVDGHTYEVLRSSTGYKTRGIASWYGVKFHKQRTSSGEPYNMYVMTAAHKTLPLPTYVKVKNLNNGRVAIVKVNDRGPFHANRVIDLSYAAALKLGVFPKGTAPVEIETLMGPSGQSHYYLQAGAFSSEFLAKHLKKKLTDLTPSPVFIEHYQQHYLVKVGPFSDKYMADHLKKTLAHNGVSGSFTILI